VGSRTLAALSKAPHRRQGMSLSKPYSGKRYGHDCGGQRAPFINVSGTLEQPLFDLLRRETIDALRHQLGGKLLESNKVKITDWHAVVRGRRLTISVPRPGPGHTSVPSAPDSLMTFIEAFRGANGDIFREMAQRMRQLGSEAGRIVAQAIEEGRIFGILEVQTYHGGRSKDAGWHIDGATSLLHLSITLGGARELLVEYADKADKGSRSHKVPQPMSSGDVYLSSPFLFYHGVKHQHSSSFDGGSLAIQMRIGFTSKDHFRKLNDMRNSEMRKVAEVVADVLGRSSVKLPTYADVVGGKGLKRKEPEEPAHDGRAVARPRLERPREDAAPRAGGAGAASGSAVHERAGGNGKTGLRNQPNPSRDPEYMTGAYVSTSEEVQVLEEQGDWSRVRTNNGSEGWLQKKYLRR